MRINPIVLGVAVVPTVLAVQPAFAANFVYDAQYVGGNTHVGFHKSITTSFNTQTEYLTWSSTFEEKNNRLADGAWLVLSDGPNPKAHKQQYTMFYMDGVNEKLTAYTYNGGNNSSSYNTNTFLGSWDLTVEENAAGDERTFSFGLDMTDINNRTDLGPDWEGTQFGEKVGIWFHGLMGVDADYNDDGSLKTFSFDKQGWYDTKDQMTEAVPEPGMLAGAGVVAAALGVVRRKRLATETED